MQKNSTKRVPQPSEAGSSNPSPRTKSELRAEQVVARLLDAATQLFMEKGYDTSSMGEIARCAHASKETFYRHFPTKEDLFRAVILRRAQLMTLQFGAILSPNDPPVKALTAFGELVLEKFQAGKASGIHRVLSMERERFPDFAEIFHKNGPAKVHAALSDYLTEQIARGLLRKMDTRMAARQFFDLVAAEIIIGATPAARRQLSQPEIRQRVEEAVDCFLHGYGGSSDASSDNDASVSQSV